MKLFIAKCHERATLLKLWRQTENSSLFSAKCSPLLHVIRACSWRWPDVVAGISARFSKFAFVLSSSRETLRFSGNKIHCSPRDQSLSVKCCMKISTSFKFEPTTPNMSQHIATGWPNARKTVLANVAICCVEMLRGFKQRRRWRRRRRERRQVKNEFIYILPAKFAIV